MRSRRLARAGKAAVRTYTRESCGQRAAAISYHVLFSLVPFAALSADAPAHLTILGDGPCRGELEALSRRLGQQRRISFPGLVADVTPYLKEADVYLSSSVSEGMSNALLEAMSQW